ncbi:hypothetical protein C9412_10510 [Stenotrophomonas sp. Nf1]|nr:hypothetical protein C9412_10510 [Stenotrophomonas sp. Nf1]PTA81591.1 hypothetical protein C9416_08060 [Stenotrophomonas sp. Nf4]
MPEDGHSGAENVWSASHRDRARRYRDQRTLSDIQEATRMHAVAHFAVTMPGCWRVWMRMRSWMVSDTPLLPLVTHGPDFQPSVRPRGCCWRRRGGVSDAMGFNATHLISQRDQSLPADGYGAATRAATAHRRLVSPVASRTVHSAISACSATAIAAIATATATSFVNTYGKGSFAGRLSFAHPV